MSCNTDFSDYIFALAHLKIGNITQLGSRVSSSLLTSVAASSLPITISAVQGISTVAAGEVDFALDTAGLEHMNSGGDAGLGDVGIADGSEEDHQLNPSMQVDGSVNCLEPVPQFDGMGDEDDGETVAEEDDGLISQAQAAFQDVEEEQQQMEQHEQQQHDGQEQQSEQHHMDDIGEADLHQLQSDTMAEGFSSAEQGKAFLDDFQSMPVEPLMEGFPGTDDAAEAGEGEGLTSEEGGISHTHSDEQDQYHREEADFLLQVRLVYALK